MSYPDVGALVVSALPALEPISATGFAINISYLNLERFRYRKQIREPARALLTRLRDGNSDFLNKIDKQEYIVELVWLAAIEDADDNNRNPPPKMPQSVGLWGRVYTHLFHQHLDRRISGIMTVISLGALILGPVHELNLAPWGEEYFMGAGAWASWIVLSSSAFLPILFVLLGRKVVKWGRGRVAHISRQLEMFMQGDAKLALETFVTEQTTSEE